MAVAAVVSMVDGTFFNSSMPNRIFLFTIVTIWMLRIVIYLTRRALKHGQEDYRYQEFRRQFGAHRYWWVSYFHMYLPQGFLALIVSLPLSLTMTRDVQAPAVAGMSVLALPSLAIWMFGYAMEAGGDIQLSRHMAKPRATRPDVLQTGWWRYTRHPNYAGDAIQHWAFLLPCLGTRSWIGVVGTLAMNLIIRYYSGVYLTEKHMLETHPGFAAYKKRTSVFWPWFPKTSIEADEAAAIITSADNVHKPAHANVASSDSTTKTSYHVTV